MSFYAIDETFKASESFAEGTRKFNMTQALVNSFIKPEMEEV